MAKIAVAMSGGVDSSVAAHILQSQGHELLGLTLELLPTWLAVAHPKNSAEKNAAAVALKLGIEHKVIDARDEFSETVLSNYANEYLSGRTPNPCVVCNQNIKFGLLFKAAKALGCDYLATGHYVGTVVHEGQTKLVRARDDNKDQSYFMYRIPSHVLSHCLFPLSNIDKLEVKRIATELGIEGEVEEESQDICFAAPGYHEEILKRLSLLDKDKGGQTLSSRLEEEGDFVDSKGNIVGRHRGISHYTIGQRKGLNLAGMPEPYYVTAINAKTNQIEVGPLVETYVEKIKIEDIVGTLKDGREYLVQLRYRMKAVPASYKLDTKGDAWLHLREPLSAIAAGQSLVCYSAFDGKEIVQGGGIIRCVV